LPPPKVEAAWLLLMALEKVVLVFSLKVTRYVLWLSG